MSFSATPPTIVFVEDLDSSSVQTTTTAVQMCFIDPSSSTDTELAPADPEKRRPPSERIDYVPAAVAMCPLNSPLEGANVFLWSANAILGTIKEASRVDNSAFDDGGLVETVAIPYIRDLQHRIRDQYFNCEQFDEDCKGLDEVLTDVCATFYRLQQSRFRTGEVDLDNLRPPPCLFPSYPEDCEDRGFHIPLEDFEQPSPYLNQQQQQQYYTAPPCIDDCMEDTGYCSVGCDSSDISDDDYMYVYPQDDVIYDDHRSSSSSNSNGGDQSYKKAGQVTCEPSLSAGEL